MNLYKQFAIMKQSIEIQKLVYEIYTLLSSKSMKEISNYKLQCDINSNSRKHEKI